MTMDKVVGVGKVVDGFEVVALRRLRERLETMPGARALIVCATAEGADATWDALREIEPMMLPAVSSWSTSEMRGRFPNGAKVLVRSIDDLHTMHLSDRFAVILFSASDVQANMWPRGDVWDVEQDLLAPGGIVAVGALPDARTLADFEASMVEYLANVRAVEPIPASEHVDAAVATCFVKGDSVDGDGLCQCNGPESTCDDPCRCVPDPAAVVEPGEHPICAGCGAEVYVHAAVADRIRADGEGAREADASTAAAKLTAAIAACRAAYTGESITLVLDELERLLAREAGPDLAEEIAEWQSASRLGFPHGDPRDVEPYDLRRHLDAVERTAVDAVRLLREAGGGLRAAVAWRLEDLAVGHEAGEEPPPVVDSPTYTKADVEPLVDAATVRDPFDGLSEGQLARMIYASMDDRNLTTAEKWRLSGECLHAQYTRIARFVLTLAKKPEAADLAPGGVPDGAHCRHCMRLLGEAHVETCAVLWNERAHGRPIPVVVTDAWCGDHDPPELCAPLPDLSPASPAAPRMPMVATGYAGDCPECGDPFTPANSRAPGSNWCAACVAKPGSGA